MKTRRRFLRIAAATALAVAVGTGLSLGSDPAPAQAGSTSYGLPFLAGTSVKVTQSPGGSYSHKDAYNSTAVDWGVSPGTPIVASRSGTVHFEGWNGPGGIMALINHGGDTCTQYAHLSSTIVDKGQYVLKGQVIGYSGGSSNGRQNALAAHLHWAGVSCATQKATFVVNTAETGTSYPNGAVIRSTNAGDAIVNPKSNRCLDVQGGSTASGVPVQLYDCNRSAAQVWKYDPGTKALVVYGTRCLDITGGGTLKSGTKVQSYACNGTNAQKWTLFADGTIRPAAATGLCLDASGGATANGTRVQVYSCNGTAAQVWR